MSLNECPAPATRTRRPCAAARVQRLGDLLDRARAARSPRAAALVAGPVAPLVPPRRGRRCECGVQRSVGSLIGWPSPSLLPSQAAGPRLPALARCRRPGAKRATVIGAGSFGTALAVLLARGGLRTTLQTRTAEQAQALEERAREPRLPAGRRAARAAAHRAGRGRRGTRRLRVPGRALAGARARSIAGLREAGLGRARRWCRSPRASSRPTDYRRPACSSAALRRPARGLPRRPGPRAGDGARRRRAGGGRRSDEELARALAQVFTRAGVVCEQSNDPLGVELAGAAKNAAALAAGATEAQGLNAAGAAAGHIFAEVWRYAETLGARPESMIGLAGAGDLVATALGARKPQPPRRRAAGRRACRPRRSPARIGQAVEALESVPLLARALEQAEVRGAGHERARAADLGRAAAPRVGRAGPRDRAPARAVAPAPAAGLLAAAVAAR